MPKYGYSALGPPQIEILITFHFHYMRFINILTTSHQPLCGDYFTSRYDKKRILGPKFPNMVFRPQAPPKNEKFDIFHYN